jgi:bifunctional non-homologous end joining protein LigD
MLREYQLKKDFMHAPEPQDKSETPGDSLFIFVVHNHAAQRPHYDFRLEINGALKSWEGSSDRRFRG